MNKINHNIEMYYSYKNNINAILVSIIKQNEVDSAVVLEQLFLKKCEAIGTQLAAALVSMDEAAFMDNMAPFSLFFYDAFINPDSGVQLLPNRELQSAHIRRALTEAGTPYLQRYETLTGYARTMSSFVKKETWNPFQQIITKSYMEDDDDDDGSFWEHMISGDLE